MKTHRFLVALLGPVLACSAVNLNLYADNVEDDEILVDTEGEEEWIDIEEELTPAISYYSKLGREHPLFDVVDGDNYQAIVDSANVVLALFPDDLFSINQRCRAYYGVGDNESAIKDALKIYCEPNDDPFPSRFAQYLIDVDPAMVKRNLDRYTKYYLAKPDPNLADYCTYSYLLALADVEKNLNNRVQAFKVAKIAAKIDRAHNDAPLMMSTLLLQNGTPEEALKVLKPYMRDIESVTTSVFHNYILALRDCGKSKEAYKLFDKVLAYDLETDRRWSLLSDYACLYAANEDYAKALPMFDSLIAEIEAAFEDDLEEAAYFTNLPELYLRRGIIYSILGEPEKAKEDIDRTLSFNEDEDHYTGLEVTAYAWLGDRDNALKWMEIFSNVTSDSDRTFPTYAILGDTDAAIRDLKYDFDNHLTAPDQIEYDPNYVKLRATPEYKELVKTFKPLPMK